jgi:hypothetical protein
MGDRKAWLFANARPSMTLDCASLITDNTGDSGLQLPGPARALLPDLPNVWYESAGGNKVIRHVVFYKFKPETTPEQRDLAVATLRALPEKIDFIRHLEVGLDVLRSPRSWDGVLVSTFDDLSSLEAYSRHEHHLPVVELMKSLCEAIGSVDFEVD